MPPVDPAALGLTVGEPCRFRRGRGRWHPAKLEGVERDGSIALRDEKGAARSLRPQDVEVRAAGPRGALRWERLADRMSRGEQLELF